MPHSHIPIMLTLHFMCVHIFDMVNIDVPGGVGAPPLDTQPTASNFPDQQCIRLAKSS